MTLTYEPDLDRVKVNHHTVYLVPACVSRG